MRQAGGAAKTLAGLRHLRPWRRLVAFDLDPARSAALTPHVMGNAHDVSAEADVVVLATWPYQPLLHFRDVRAGHHLTTLGADEPGKVELSADLLQRAHVIVDDLELAATSGALANAGLDAGAAAGTLSDVLQGGLAGRQSEDLVTVYAPIGLPWQDLALTWALYSRAKAREVPSLRAVWLRASTGRQATATPPRTTRRS